MNDMRQMIPAIGLLATGMAVVYMVVQLGAQTTRPTGDYTNAAVAQVRDALGQVILSGQFQLGEEEDDDMERKAALSPTGIDADAAGEAEVEFSKATPAEQEVEFAVRNVAPGAVLTFLIDDHEVATATADARGRAKIELEVRMPGTGASR